VNKVVPFSMIYVSVGLGVVLGAFVVKLTKANEAPSWFWTLSFVGFFVALNWIFLLANEVVGLLQVK
jgi:sodium/potassium/calcium exchanger 6